MNNKPKSRANIPGEAWRWYRQTLQASQMHLLRPNAQPPAPRVRLWVWPLVIALVGLALLLIALTFVAAPAAAQTETRVYLVQVANNAALGPLQIIYPPCTYPHPPEPYVCLRTVEK